MSNKLENLRSLFQKPGLIRAIGAHDGLSAKLGELAGFDVIWASGLEISASHGVPDANIITMTEYLNAAIDMNDATSIPVIADCDTGYGNSSNVMRMVEKYESAGIAAVSIEDKKFPKNNSLLAGGRQELASIAEFVGKLLAAKSTQKKKDFMVLARIEALIAGWDQDEALKRAYAYADAGADAILIHSKKKDPKEIIDFAKSWDGRKPLVAVPTTYNTITGKELENLGFKLAIYANHGLRSSIAAMKSTFAEIKRSDGTFTIEDKIVPLKEVFELQGTMRLKELEKKYLKGELDDVSVVILAAGDSATKEPSLKDLLSERPLTMLDVNGKPILGWIVQTLHNVGLKDIYIVAGYKSDNINIEGVSLVENKNFDKTHILDSLMCARQHMKGRLLVSYSDLVFDRLIVDRLLKTKGDITIVVDPTSRNSAKEPMERLIATHAPLAEVRQIGVDSPNPVKKISKKIPADEMHYEFAGIAMFSSKGLNILKREYENARQDFSGKKFYDANSFEKASLIDMLQYLVDKGHVVDTLEVTSGWSEIRTFEDYKRTCRLLSYRD